MAADGQPVVVVLGGGGAKGIVHIGVLKAIHAQGMRIVAIFGTSIGAIWGALYAATITSTYRGHQTTQAEALQTLEQFAYGMQFRHYVDLNWRRLFTSGIARGDAFENWLTTLLWNTQAAEGRETDGGPQHPLTFKELQFPLTLTATAALTGETIICDAAHTDYLTVARAVRASMSIQGFFKNVTLDLRQPDGTMLSVPCWDGGTTGNCRFDLAAREYSQYPIIASSLTYRGEPTEVEKGLTGLPRRLTRIREHSINILMRQTEQLLRENVKHDSLLVLTPPLSGLTTFAFNVSNAKKVEAINSAYTYARHEIAALRRR